MKKSFALIITLITMLLSTLSAFALPRLANSDAILADMYANPGKYIKYGGASIGLSFLLDKTSVNVHKYNPPEYIIAVKVITHFNNGQGGEAIEDETLYRYLYNYKNKKMYIERKNDNGLTEWKMIDPTASKSYHDDNWVSLGETMFYLAYNMSFYDKPIIATEFINRGLSVLPLVKLSSVGNYVSHFYNHRTHRVELWKRVWNNQTKEFDFTKVK